MCKGVIMSSQITDFNDLNAWKKAHELTLYIYTLTQNFPKEEKYGIIIQLRRASSSIGANIAEGFSRYHFKDKIRFYYNARASAAEVQYFLILSRDLAYIDSEMQKRLHGEYASVKRMTNGLISSLQKLTQASKQ
jgi:four helix bundle protein